MTITKDDVTNFARYFANSVIVANPGKSRSEIFALIDELRDGVMAHEVECAFLSKPPRHAVDTDPGVTLRNRRA